MYYKQIYQFPQAVTEGSFHFIFSSTRKVVVIQDVKILKKTNVKNIGGSKNSSHFYLAEAILLQKTSNMFRVLMSLAR